MSKLLHGPLNKNIYTHTLELITKILLYSPNDAIFHYQKTGVSDEKELHVNVGEVDINLTLLFSKANFSHIQMDHGDSAKFTQNTGINYGVFYPNVLGYVTSHVTLTEAEKRAVHHYQGTGYRAMNDMLYRKYGNEYSIANIKDEVLKSVMLASGLNKIFPTPEEYKVKTYRGESHTSKKDIQERIKLVNQGGGYTEQLAFMSTSTNQSISKGFASGYNDKCMIYFDSIYGVSVEKASGSNFENEYLIVPGQIYWKQYELVNGVHTFHAEAVKPLVPSKDEICSQDIVNFNKLVELAKSKGVSDAFLTPYIKDVISKPVESNDTSQTVVPVMKQAKPVPKPVSPAWTPAPVWNPAPIWNPAPVWNPAPLANQKSAKVKALLAFTIAGGVGLYLTAIGLGLIAAPLGITSFPVLIGAGIVGVSMLLSVASLFKKFFKNQPLANVPAVYHAPVVPAAPVNEPVILEQNNVPQNVIQINNEYNTFLQKEEKAVKELESILKSKFPEAPNFITKLHDTLGLDKANGDKLLLLQYAHLLENRVNEAHPLEFPVVEKEVLEEAATAIKEKTLLI